MALLGAQLVITLVMVSLIQKIGPYFSLAKFLLCSTGLTRYLYPTNSELRLLAGVSKEKSKNKKPNKHLENNGKSKDTFHVPRSLDIQLETSKVSSLDVIHLRYYMEYQWLVDFALYAAIVYIMTEIYQIWFSISDEINLSIMWCLLVLGFSMKILLSLTVLYFQAEESIGERSTCIVTGFSYLFVSMIILIIDENTLELGLDKAYASFNDSATMLLDSQGLISPGPASKIVLKFFIAVWCGLIGALFTFPGLRMAKMHWDSLKYCNENAFLKFVLNITFIMPFLLVILWIKPICREYLTIRVFTGLTEPLMNEATFESMRIIAIVCTVLVRILLMPIYLQTYLNMAYHRVEQQKKEAGRITNVELQKKIAAVFYYLCVVALQYILPLMICLYLTLVYKSLGDFSWIGAENVEKECPIDGLIDQAQEESDISKSAKEFTLALSSFKLIFTTDVYRGLFGFATWWCCFVWFASTSLGMMYQTYFSQL